MKKYEIWIGNYHLGQGYDPPTEPQRLAIVMATSFRCACYLYELESAAKSLKERMILFAETGNKNYSPEDIHFGVLYYNPKLNANSWTSLYHETKESAQLTFKN